MIKRKYLLAICRLVVSFIAGYSSCYSQGENLALGQWRIHLPFNQVHSVADGGQNIYCAGRDGIFIYNKNDGNISRLTRLEGLSDFDITHIRYNTAYNILVVAYINSNVDLIYPDNSIYNLSDLKRAEIIGNKTINHIDFDGRYAYLSCGFGILVVDLVRKEVKDTYFIGPNGTQIVVYGTVVSGSKIFAATENGIYKADANNPLLSLYSSWLKDTTLPDPNKPYNFLCLYGNNIIANNDSTPTNNSVMMFDGTTWSYFNPNDKTVSYRMEYSGNHLTIVNGYSISAFNTSGTRTHYCATDCYPNPSQADGFIDAQDVLWVGDKNNGLVKIVNPVQIIYPNGPYSVNAYAMASKDNRLWVAGGMISGDGLFANNYSKDGAYLLKNNFWTTLNKTTCHQLDTVNFFDFISVAIDPYNPDHAFIASWGSGLFEFNADNCIQTTIYNESNSTLGSYPNTYNIRVGGLAFDSQNNLWMTNTSSASPISVKRADGAWQTYSPASLLNTIPQEIICDSRDRKWIVLPGNNGIVVFDETQTFSHASNESQDTHARKFTTEGGKGKLPSLDVQSIAEDHDGQIWIGTAKGVAVLYSPDNVYSDNYDFAQVTLKQEGNFQHLLETETVTAIAVDGANRKWFGTTSSGVYLMSPDGTQQVLHFSTDNSPLLSNNILCIAIDQKTGEVFFGTENGIVSYKSDAIEGGDEFDNVYAYPNPVRPGYSGPIAIRGLIANANIKITDISGTLVYETKANGGEAIWYGKNFKGERAQSGVYLVFCSNSDGSKTFVTKLLLMQ